MPAAKRPHRRLHNMRSTAYSSASNGKSATFFDRYAGGALRHAFRAAFASQWGTASATQSSSSSNTEIPKFGIKPDRCLWARLPMEDSADLLASNCSTIHNTALSVTRKPLCTCGFGGLAAAASELSGVEDAAAINDGSRLTVSLTVFPKALRRVGLQFRHLASRRLSNHQCGGSYQSYSTGPWPAR